MNGFLIFILLIILAINLGIRIGFFICETAEEKDAKMQ
jgi:uncharacterized protein YneF (UPF0154 family)